MSDRDTDTEIRRTEPPIAGDEAATLLGILDRQRATLAWNCGGLDARAGVAEALAGGGLDQPVTGITNSRGESPNLRRVLVDLLDEYGRHVGHADLIRESVDGLTGEDPPR